MTHYNKKALLKEIREEEWFVPHAYQDHLGYWTIGIGTLIDKRKGGKISLAAAEFMANESILGITDRLDSAIPWWRELNPVRQRVLINMAYQMGTSGLLKFTRTLEHVRQKDFEAASRHMLDSKWAKQTPERAQRLAERMKTGIITP